MNKSGKGIDMQYLFMCRSLTYAQRAQRYLERFGISAGILKAPSSLGTNGCAYCLTVSEAKFERSAELLKNESFVTGRIYIRKSDGSIEEICR